MFNDSRKLLTTQFIKFNLVGLLNTAIDFILFTLLVWLGAHYIAAQVVSYAAGMLNSFVLNNAFTFRANRPAAALGFEWKTGLRFIAWNGIVLLVSLFLLFVFTRLWGFNEILAKMAVTIITVAVNFYGSKRWVFVRQHE